MIRTMLLFAAQNRVWVSAKGKERATRNPGKHRRVADAAAADAKNTLGLRLSSASRTLSVKASAMTRVTEAVYSKGVLKPAEDLGLREEQRVRLIIESVDERPQDRAAGLARLKAGIAKMQFFSQGPLPSREELHDRS